MPGKDGSRKKWRGLAAQPADYLVTVVDWLPEHDADRAFERWLDDVGVRRGEIRPKDLVVETDNRDRRAHRRYRVHLDAIPE
jgi:hypothetical protein